MYFDLTDWEPGGVGVGRTERFTLPRVEGTETIPTWPLLEDVCLRDWQSEVWGS